MRGLLGIAAILGFAWAISEDRWRVPWRIVGVGVLLQFALALIFLKFPPATAAFLVLNQAVEALQKATEAGTGFVFGYLGGGELPFAESTPGQSFIFAFRALPMVLVVSALATLLFYWGVLQRIVQAFAWVLRRTVGVGGPLGLGAAVHIFVGHIEAPLLIRPYLLRMTRGELFALMSCGMAGIAGTVMVLYASLLGPVIPDALGNILMAAVISTPAALAIAALMVPFRPDPAAGAQLAIADPPVSSMDAVAKGTRDGIVFLANIVASLVVVVALVSLVNSALGLVPAVEVEAITLQRLFAYAIRPVMCLIGVPGPVRRQAAGGGFLRGFVRHGGTDRLCWYARSEATAQAFMARVEAHGAQVPATWIPFAQPQRLAEPGRVFYPTVGVHELAWRRRRHDQ